MQRKSKRKHLGGCIVPFVVVMLIGLSTAAGFSMLVKKGIISDHYQIASVANMAEALPFQEITIDEKEFVNKYYYQQLTSDEQLIYKEILQGIRNDAKEIYLHMEDGERAMILYQYVLYDYPEFFWCSESVHVTYNPSAKGQEGYSILQPTYSYEGIQKEQMKQAVEREVSTCLASISSEATEYEKIKYAYEYIINTTDYNSEASDNQNIYSVFVNKQSVCAGYARANQYLLERMGMFCTYVTGEVTSDERGTQLHAWNMVRCDGEYYYVDATWGDPIYLEGEEKQGANINYDYLCCNQDELFKTHTIQGEISFPECHSMEYNYYVINGMYYEVFDRDEALHVMKNDINQGRSNTVFKYGDALIYQEASNIIINELLGEAAQYLMKSYGLQEVKYYYQLDETANRITLYWKYE
ncbi:transglutaminase domain-containing protein [Lachnospiraceae bacterium LCP25S3_G4]